MCSPFTSVCKYLIPIWPSRRCQSQLIRLQRIYNFRCSMLILYHLSHVLYAFYCIYLRFLNLLTRCPVSVSCFLLFFVSRKPTQEIFLELHGTKTHVHIFPSRTRRPKERWRGAVEPPHHLVAQVPPSARWEVVWGP